MRSTLGPLKPAARRIGAVLAMPVSLLAVFPSSALARGDMDGLGYLILGIYVYMGVVVVGSIVALVACRHIANRCWRTVARWLIVVLLYTPVPRAGSALPVFMTAFEDKNYWPHAGFLSHPILLAYAGVVLLSGPVVALWIYVSERYLSGDGLARNASQAQRASVMSSAATQAPPT